MSRGTAIRRQPSAVSFGRRRAAPRRSEPGGPATGPGPHACAWGSDKVAFTLVEMLVSLAVLALALSVVGVVFTITTQTASQSAAYSEVHNRVQQFVWQLKEDLAHCDPANSLLVLVGRTCPAALTQADLEAGKFYRVLTGNPGDPQLQGYDPEYAPDLDTNRQYSNPRADILMFISNRPTASAVPNPDPAANPAYAAGVKFSPIRVLYGHASLEKPAWTGTGYVIPKPQTSPTLRHIERTVNVGGRVLSEIPASHWHLSRLGTILEYRVGATRLSEDACTNLASGQPYRDHWNYTSGYYPGDAAGLDLPLVLQSFGPSSGAALLSPYQYPYDTTTAKPWPNQSSINTLLYASFDNFPNVPDYDSHHVATVLEEVPVDLKGNLAVHMLPGCAWFQVEFLMPEDPRNSVIYSSPNPANSWLAQYPSSRRDTPRWMSVAPGQTYVFVPDTEDNRRLVARQVDTSGAPLDRLLTFGRFDQIWQAHFDPNDAVSSRIIRMWPYAIRVTVRVWDARGQLAEPIVRSVVHSFE